ncbi:DUF1127 domain-containing protein [Roseovarius sp. SCSIO 43702]|uniref:DUF1127 domain-containing protein n=1 Tax=Roseovarius sp. SCSIO 43702 TaxID=2823043 RepID=UPI001C732050|nr:DUF1127 domain-containing protein [Roseovarius sp. SCSIO 43702]QYX56933.1 DUF1127 domain-containing protein [Roseovarius sp. SCSIO 43702]
MVFASDILSGRGAGNETARNGFFGQTISQIQKWREFNKTRNELASLSDRALADLGISRGEIDSIARRSVYGHAY